MHHVRMDCIHSHSIARFFERCNCISSIVLPKKIPEKPRVVRQVYITAQKKSNTFVKLI